MMDNTGIEHIRMAKSSQKEPVESRKSGGAGNDAKKMNSMAIMTKLAAKILIHLLYLVRLMDVGFNSGLIRIRP
nr:hypothetical protein [Candidatus Sigynarchaeota archaeon]